MSGRGTAHYLGLMLALFGVAESAPAAVAAYYGERYWPAYLLASAAMLLVGAVLARLTRPEALELPEASAVALASFITPALVNAAIWTLYGVSFVNALFDSVSGITTTGLSVLGGRLPHSLVFARAWLQWLGGLGIVVLTLSMLLKPGSASHKLLVIHFRKPMGFPGSRVLSRAVVLIYVALTAAALTAYIASGLKPFDSLVYSLTTVSTGGFTSYARLAGPSLLVASVFMFISAQSFLTYFKLLRRDFKSLIRDPQTISFVTLLVLGGAIMYLSNPRLGISKSFFESLSAVSTTGFPAFPLHSLGGGGVAALTILMFVGAAVGSTGGGIKEFRLVVILKAIWRVLKESIAPKGEVRVVKVGGEPLTEGEVLRCFAVAAAYAVALAASTTVLAACGYSFTDSLLACASSLGTVGLQPSFINPSLPLVPKIVLIINMLLGRLEVLTVLVAVSSLTQVRER